MNAISQTLVPSFTSQSEGLVSFQECLVSINQPAANFSFSMIQRCKCYKYLISRDHVNPKGERLNTDKTAAVMVTVVAITGLLLLLLTPSMSFAQQTTTTTNMTKYTDPQGRFSVSYPTSWTVTPAQNRFEGPIVKFEDTTAGLNLNVDIVNGLGADPDAASRAMVSSGGPLGYTLFQDVECVKYKVDGQKACSLIYTKEAQPTLGTQGVVATQLLSYVDGSMYVIDFGAPPSIFDSVLPTFDAMVHSFKATGNSTGVSTK
jgi:hypothetical protein